MSTEGPPTDVPWPPSQIRAVFFDLDGTLIDTDDTAVDRLARRLRPLLGRRSRRTARWLLMKAETPGNLVVTLLDYSGLDSALMGITDRLRRSRGLRPAHQFQLIPGVEQMLSELQRSPFAVALVTTRSRYHVERLFEQFPQIGSAIEAVCARQDTRRLKPHPAPVLLAAERLGVPIENCLMVGDTTVDVKAARRAGAWSVAVLCGFGERDELERAGAHAILENTPQITHLI